MLELAPITAVLSPPSSRARSLEISAGAARALQQAGLQPIRDLCRRSESELLKMRGLDRRQLAELEQILGDLGLSLGMRDV